MDKLWYNQPAIKSYADAQALFDTARNPELGKPVKKWCRMFKSEDVFLFRASFANTLVAAITEDNTLEITMSTKDMRRLSNTLTGALHRLLPIAIVRLGTGRYSAMHYSEIDKRYEIGGLCGGVDRFMRKEGYEVFQGMKFDLTTGRCINPKPSIKDSVDTTKRTEWLRALRKFKRGVVVRAKLGVVDSVCSKVVNDRNSSNSWRKPDWFDEQWIGLLHTSIRDGQYPTELLVGFAQSADVSYWKKEAPTPRKVLLAMDAVCNDLSVELRRRFGVFGE